MPTSLRLVTATVLALAVAQASAEETRNPPAPKPCSKPQYPAESARLGEEGISEIGFLIGTDGTVKRTVVLHSSGSAALDAAAQQILSTCVFRPALSNGQAIAAWAPVAYRWFLDEHTNDSRVRMRLQAVLKDNPDDANALYYSSLLEFGKHGAEDDHKAARALQRRAAELGHPFAQFKIGQSYEKGKGVQADHAEALRWYEKSAAQGNVFAIERLATNRPVY